MCARRRRGSRAGRPRRGRGRLRRHRLWRRLRLGAAFGLAGGLLMARSEFRRSGHLLPWQSPELRRYSGTRGPCDSRKAHAVGATRIAAAGRISEHLLRHCCLSGQAAGLGIITTVAGTTPGHGGDGGPANLAQLNQPHGLAFDAADNLYISAHGNHRVRRVSAPNVAPTAIGLAPQTVAENEPVATTVGTLTTTDPDLGDSHTYTLVSGAGDTDNARFTIGGVGGDELLTAESFDVETQGPLQRPGENDGQRRTLVRAGLHDHHR